jgi:hypothetical protein
MGSCHSAQRTKECNSHQPASDPKSPQRAAQTGAKNKNERRSVPATTALASQVAKGTGRTTDRASRYEQPARQPQPRAAQPYRPIIMMTRVAPICVDIPRRPSWDSESSTSGSTSDDDIPLPMRNPCYATIRHREHKVLPANARRGDTPARATPLPGLLAPLPARQVPQQHPGGHPVRPEWNVDFCRGKRNAVVVRYNGPPRLSRVVTFVPDCLDLHGTRCQAATKTHHKLRRGCVPASQRSKERWVHPE